MNQEIKPLELLFVWRLAVAGGGDWLKDIKPDPGSPARKRLQADGVIEQEKRKSPTGRGTAVFISLTDRGWGWLGNHLDADLSTRTQAGTEVLHRLLLRLKTFIDQKQLSLGDLILPGEENRQTMSKTWRIVLRVPISHSQRGRTMSECGLRTCVMFWRPSLD